MDLHYYAEETLKLPLHLKEYPMHIPQVMVLNIFEVHLKLFIAKYPCHYVLWCHLWRNFYALGVRLILFSWLHHVSDCLKRILLQIYDVKTVLVPLYAG